MKKSIFIFAAVVLAAALLLAGCGAKPDPGTAPTNPVPSDFDEAPVSAEFPQLLQELQGLDNLDESTFVRGVTGAQALNETLKKGKDEAIRLKTDSAEPISIDAGDYSGAALVLEAGAAGFTSDAALGRLIVNAVGPEGLTLRGHVGTLAVYGENANAVLSGGADTVYVQGKNCTLRLTGGVYGKIVSVNQTVVIVNETDADVTVYMANGVPQTLKAGDTLEF